LHVDWFGEIHSLRRDFVFLGIGFHFSHKTFLLGFTHGDRFSAVRLANRFLKTLGTSCILFDHEFSFIYWVSHEVVIEN
jgi:hypothetical protein